MLNSITINTTKSTLSAGKLAECLLFYDEVNMVLDAESLHSLWNKVTYDEMYRLKDYGLKLYLSRNTPGFVPANKGDDIWLAYLGEGDLKKRALELAMWGKLRFDALDNEGQKVVNKFYDISHEYSFDTETVDVVKKDVGESYVHKRIMQDLLDEISSGISLFDPRVRYEFRIQSNQKISFDTNLPIGRLRDMAEKAGRADMILTHASLLLEMVEAYQILKFSADNNSTLWTNPMRSVIISNKEKSILEKAKADQSVINGFESANQIPTRGVAEVIDSGEKTFSEFLQLLDKAQEFKQWKHDLPSESDFIREYMDAIEKNVSWVERTPGKILRFITTSGLGFIPVVGGVIGTTASAFDNFVFEKWVSGGWKPAQFVSGPLKKFTTHKI